MEQFKKPFSTFPSVRNSSLTDAIHLGQTGHLASPCFAIKEDFKPEITPGDSSCWFPSSQWHLTDESSNFSRLDFHRFRTVNCAVLVTLLRQIQFVSNFLFWPLLNLGFSNKDYSTTVLPNAIFCFFSHLWNFLSYGTFFFLAYLCNMLRAQQLIYVEKNIMHWCALGVALHAFSLMKTSVKDPSGGLPNWISF